MMTHLHQLSGRTELETETLRRLAPSIFAETPWHAMSSKYTFIPTIHVVEALRQHGLVPVQANQSRTRIEGKGSFTKHLIRFQIKETPKWTVGETRPEVVLVNSHDGRCSFQIMAGMYRLVCANGMIVGNTLHQAKTRHTGDVVDDVIEATYRVIDDLPQIQDTVRTWMGKDLTLDQQQAYAQAALGLRWEENQAPIEPRQLLGLRRPDDRHPTLWHTFNMVQENLMRGGLNGRSSSGRRTRTREIKSVNADVRLNRALWQLTEHMASLA